MAISVCGLILSMESKPVMAKMCCELTRIWDGVQGFNGDSTEEYSGQTW
jgi:hypothetical protein